MSNVTLKAVEGGAWRVFVDDHEVTMVRDVRLDPAGPYGASTVTLVLHVDDFNVAHEVGMEPVKVNKHPSFGFDLGR